jgi:hypothetical protein
MSSVNYNLGRAHELLNGSHGLAAASWARAQRAQEVCTVFFI